MRHIGDACAARLFTGLAGAVHQRNIVNDNGALGDFAAAAAIAHGCKSNGGLACAGFTNQAKHFAALQRHIDMIDKCCVIWGFNDEIGD